MPPAAKFVNVSNLDIIASLGCGEFTAELMPMRCFPDNIRIRYQLFCYGHFDSCDTCCTENDKCTCKALMEEDDSADSDVESGPLKAALLRVVHKVNIETKMLPWADVFGNGSHVEECNDGCTGYCAWMPGAHHLPWGVQEFADCSYGTGAAYVRVAFKEHPDWSFNMAVVGISHDT